VEFAIVVPLLLLLVFGIVDFGRALNAQIMVTQAAREGARWDALGDNQVQIAQRVTQAGQPLSGLNTSVSSLCGPGSAGQTGSVTVSYTFTFATPVGSLMSLLGGKSPGGTMAITGTGVMRCQG
jgi:Flp pilus assembly protein TadG